MNLTFLMGKTVLEAESLTTYVQSIIETIKTLKFLTVQIHVY